MPKGDGKYDGNLSLKCFSCNKIGYFASRCTKRMAKYDRHDKHDRNDRYEKYEKYDKPYKFDRKFRNQKNYYYVVDGGVTDEESE